MNVLRKFIPECQKCKTKQGPSTETDEQIVAYPYNGIFTQQ